MKIKAYNSSLAFMKGARSVVLTDNPTGHLSDTSVNVGSYKVVESSYWTLYYYQLTEDAQINYVSSIANNSSICVANKIPEIGDVVTLMQKTTDAAAHEGSFNATAGQFIIWQIVGVKKPTITAVME